MMTTNRMRNLENLLQQRFGFGFLCESGTEESYPVFNIRLADLKEPHGFAVKVKLAWKSLEIQFIQDSFSGHFIQEMGAFDTGKRTMAASFISALTNLGGSLEFKINGAGIDTATIEGWPVDWKTLELNYRRLGVEPDLAQFLDGSSDSFLQCLCYLGIVVALLPVEQGSYEEPLEGLPEGMLIREETNRYERNRLNREACIAAKGTTCLVCGFNFSETYGALGEGFIHVHHVVPVSQMGEGYVVDPLNDLVPVCANCHSMMHRADPPTTVDELKKIMAERKYSPRTY